jgi:hypothetical protein
MREGGLGGELWFVAQKGGQTVQTRITELVFCKGSSLAFDAPTFLEHH